MIDSKKANELLKKWGLDGVAIAGYKKVDKDNPTGRFEGFFVGESLPLKEVVSKLLERI